MASNPPKYSQRAFVILSIRSVATDARTKTNRSGDIEPCQNPFGNLLNLEIFFPVKKGLKKKQLEAFLIQQGLSTDDSVGDFFADLDANIHVVAPIFAYGLNKTTTVAVAMPYYNASTDISVGFRSNEGAESFLAALQDPLINNSKSAVEAAEKFANADGRLNTKLVDNGYTPWVLGAIPESVTPLFSSSIWPTTETFLSLQSVRESLPQPVESMTRMS